MLTAHPDIACASADVLAGSSVIDLEAAERAAAALLDALGVPCGSEVAVRTPARMVAGVAELLTGPAWEFTTFPNREDQYELVLARDVPFTLIAWRLILRLSTVSTFRPV